MRKKFDVTFPVFRGLTEHKAKALRIAKAKGFDSLAALFRHFIDKEPEPKT